MSDIVTTVDDYLAMWNEADPERRAAHIERAWAGDGRYVDPLLEAQGPAALSDMVAAVQAQYPGHRFRRVSGIDAHHDQLRFAWQLVDADGAVAAAGIDVGGFYAASTHALGAISQSLAWVRPGRDADLIVVHRTDGCRRGRGSRVRRERSWLRSRQGLSVVAGGGG
jgi:hypothetical protein